MTITKGVTSELFEQGGANEPQLIRMGQRFSGSSYVDSRRASTIGWWTTEEHEKFLEAVALHPSGPWKKIARHIGSRTPRQVTTHAQKYRQRIKRRGNRKPRGKTKSASSQVMDSAAGEMVPVEADAGTPKIIGDEEQKLWQTLLQHDTRLSEPLSLVSVDESEMFGQLTEEVSVLDFLLLGEKQHLMAPAAAILETENLDGDELMELLVDSAIDWPTPAIHFFLE